MSNRQRASTQQAMAGNAVTDGLPWEQRRWAVAAIFTALAMASLDTAIANIALPAIAGDLHVSPEQSVWVVNVYQIALVATLLPLGALGEIHKMGTAILLVEQNVSRALALVQRAYVLESGRVTMQGSSAELAGNKQVQAAYLGI